MLGICSCNMSFVSDDEEDDSKLFQSWLQTRKKKLDPKEVVEQFLKTTTIPYAIIGGQAARFHLECLPIRPCPSLALAFATYDYDVLVMKKDCTLFITDLQNTLRNRSLVPLEEKQVFYQHVSIVMIGYYKNNIFCSIVDIHIHQYKSLPNVVQTATHLKYANKEWICHELKTSIQQHSSIMEAIKTLKRKVRYELLTLT